MDLTKASYALIKEDARFIYSLVKLCENSPLKTNYMCMSIPYLGLFADGAENWCKKVGLKASIFSKEEKNFYSALRSNIKFYELGYDECRLLLWDELEKSDTFFRRGEEYYNMGVDLYGKEYCGNTILCGLYSPFGLFDSVGGAKIRRLSVAAGRLAAFIGGPTFSPYDIELCNAEPIDINYYNNNLLKLNDDIGLVLFSVLCSINYAVCFISNTIVGETPQKFKFPYLLYYYLCDFVLHMCANTDVKVELDTRLKHRELRNCLAHYGLGKYMKPNEIKKGDILYGLTDKALALNYWDAKNDLYEILLDLRDQLKKYCLVDA